MMKGITVVASSMLAALPSQVAMLPYGWIRARQSGQHVAADIVDQLRPSERGFERTLAPVQVLARDALLRAERDQIVEMFELALIACAS